MVSVSERVNSLGSESAFAVLAEVNRLNKEGKNVLSFCIGQPNFSTPENVCNAAIKAINDGKHGYTASAGIPELREAIAKYENEISGAEFRAEDVVVAAGGKPFIGYSYLPHTRLSYI